METHQIKYAPMAGRKHPRLKNFDYRTPGFYFITICTAHRQSLFGSISGGEFVKSGLGGIVCLCWRAIPSYYQNAQLDIHVVMPNHFHGIVQLLPGENYGVSPHPLGRVVSAFKGAVTRKCREARSGSTLQIWQRGYFEHVVRDEPELDKIREYIQNNPRAWEMDRENPCRIDVDPFDKWLDEQ